MEKIFQAHAMTEYHNQELENRDMKLKEARIGLVKQTGNLVDSSV